MAVDASARPPNAEAADSSQHASSQPIAVEMTSLPPSSDPREQQSSEATPPFHDQPSESSKQPADTPAHTDASADLSPSAEPSTQGEAASGPAVLITLLLVRNNARHDFRIDEKYLRRRNFEKEPWDISVYNMKELIWRDWRNDWEERPGTPAAIRLISFGRELDDKDALKACRFSTDNYNVVHMTIRPQETTEEEDAKMGKSAGRDRADAERSAGCCSCIIL